MVRGDCQGPSQPSCTQAEVTPQKLVQKNSGIFPYAFLPLLRKLWDGDLCCSNYSEPLWVYLEIALTSSLSRE